MKTIVYIKQVPDANDIKLDPKTGKLIREGVATMLNPPDAHAIEMALQLRERSGGTVTVITMGPPQAEAELKKALAMGCDEAVLLSDRALGGADTLATGYPLAKAAEKIGSYDLLLCGRHAVDAETAQTGPIIAAFLKIPQVTLVGAVELDGSWAICDRLLEDRIERVRVKLPALLTICAEANTPRYPTPINIMKALKKPRHVWTATDLGCDPAMIGLAGSPSSNRRIFEPPKHRTVTRYFTGTIDEMAQAVVDLLVAKGLV